MKLALKKHWPKTHLWVNLVKVKGHVRVSIIMSFKLVDMNRLIVKCSPEVI